ncbi:MAG: hypothetical protein IN808_01130 [Rubrobacter sp.]|nr:hypothetical protein [Rubrobacter sp.]
MGRGAHPPTEERAAAGRVALICTLWAAVHSLLASRRAKDLACRIVGPRYRNGLYRFLYNLQAVVLVAWAARRFLSLPDRELYRVPAPWSLLLRLGQCASVAVLLSGVRVIGVLDFAGISSLLDLLRGRNPRPEPEAQGPPSEGELKIAGAFRLTRHPGNLAALGIFLLFPRMTVNRAVLALFVTLYVILGSLHEEQRLRAAYGAAAYDRYRRSVPFLLPRPWKSPG